MTLLLAGAFPFGLNPSTAEEPRASTSSARTDTDARTLYQRSAYDRVIELLGAKPDLSGQEALILGLAYLQRNDAAQAIAAWRRYVVLAPGSEGRREIGAYLTLLTQQHARAEAQRLRAAAPGATQPDPQTIAVLPLANLGAAAFDPLTKGLTEMIITDLAQVRSLRVVERLRIEALAQELRLARSGLVAADSAPRAGRLLGASRVATGTMLDPAPQRLRLDAAVAQTEDASVGLRADAEGELAEFYRLEKVIVFKILCGLGVCPESLDERTRAAVEKVHTRSLAAFEHYGVGLDHLDAARYRDAAAAFYSALQEDPEFELARKALLQTPIMALDLKALIAAVEALALADDAGAVEPASLLLAAGGPPGAGDDDAFDFGLLGGAGLQVWFAPEIAQQPVVTVPVIIEIGVEK